MSERFVIESNGIWDDGKQLSWGELCDTLNNLDKLCDDKLDEYEYITELEKENQTLKEKIVGVSVLLYRINEYMEDIDLIIKWRNDDE